MRCCVLCLLHGSRRPYCGYLGRFFLAFSLCFLTNLPALLQAASVCLFFLAASSWLSTVGAGGLKCRRWVSLATMLVWCAGVGRLGSCARVVVSTSLGAPPLSPLCCPFTGALPPFPLASLYANALMPQMLLSSAQTRNQQRPARCYAPPTPPSAVS